MKEKVIKLYEFEELPAGVQEKVLNKYRDWNVDDTYWVSDEGYLELNEDEMKASDITMAEYPDLLFYYLGASPSAYDIDRGNYIQFDDLEVKDENIFRKWLGISEEVFEICGYEFVAPRNGNTYLEFTPIEDLNEKDQKMLDDAAEKFAAKMQLTLDILKQNYEYLTSDEELKEFFVENKYHFTAEGEMDNA